MDIEHIKSKFESFQNELNTEVKEAYRSRESRYYGEQLFEALEQNIREYAESLKIRKAPPIPYIPRSKVGVYPQNLTEADVRTRTMNHFWKTRGTKLDGYLSSIISDVEKGRLKPDYIASENKSLKDNWSNKIFVVHGHDDGLKNHVLRFLSLLSLEGFVLHEQASQSMTIIEKIEHYSADIGFAIVLYTGDDVGVNKASEEQHPRARQNVVFEHGYLVGKLGRKRVTPLVEDGVEIPNDISGIVYVSTSNWQIEVAKELKAAGYDIDVNKLF